MANVKLGDTTMQLHQFLQAKVNKPLKTRSGVITEITADLFGMSPEYSLAHCVGKDLKMSAGIALTFKQLFGQVAELKRQNPTVGDLVHLNQGYRYIYYLVTKASSYGKPTYFTLFCSLLKLKEHMLKWGVRKLAIPKIGCGLDRLSWNLVQQMLEHLFQASDVEIVVCCLEETSKQSKLAKMKPTCTFNKRTKECTSRNENSLFGNERSEEKANKSKKIEGKPKTKDNYNYEDNNNDKHNNLKKTENKSVNASHKHKVRDHNKNKDNKSKKKEEHKSGNALTRKHKHKNSDNNKGKSKQLKVEVTLEEKLATKHRDAERKAKKRKHDEIDDEKSEKLDRKVHKKSKTHRRRKKCKICNKKFSDKKKYKRHKRKHSHWDETSTNNAKISLK